MPRTKIKLPYEIDTLSILDEHGKLDEKLEPKIPDKDLLKLYRTMLLTREFDERMWKLQRQGRIGTFAPVKGQEAASLGSIYAIGKEDWMVPAFRETAAMLWRGWKMEQILLFYNGYEEGMHIPEDVNDLPVAIPVGTQMLHAVGIAWAAKMRGEKTVAMTYFGDGATSQGDFHEALNFAGVFQTATVFVCQNNQWAISVPLSRQTHSKTLAQKALAYDLPGVQVDGNDILAVYVAAKEAVDRARNGGGPTLIEAVTYRLGPHTTSDDPTKYRPEEEVKMWEKRDPLLRFGKYLKNKGLVDDAKMAKLQEEVDGEVRQGVERAEAQMKANPLDLFDYTFAQLPPSLQEQKKELESLLPVLQSGGD
ncbi:MAG: pyruvate dehydrogenase (acetyl-transferring) E1 component subunit alpha [Deltaproteobacteria bacterium]|nr:pyruvate dehydrogenase (acetyl-transferring) E1 component subunit alpha [Deltaproteobacteria bacterium]